MQKNIFHTLLTIVLCLDYKRKFLNLKNMSLPLPKKEQEWAIYTIHSKHKKINQAMKVTTKLKVQM